MPSCGVPTEPSDPIPTDEQEVNYLKAQEFEGRSRSEDIAYDESIPQPSQDPNVVIESDEGAEG